MHSTIKSLIRTINRNERQFALFVLLTVLLLAIFTRVPDINGQLTGLDIEQTQYYKSGKKIAEAFNIAEVIEVKVTPKDTTSAVVFKSLEEIEGKLLSNFVNIEIRSIHNASSLFKSSLENNKSIGLLLQQASSVPIIDNLISKDQKSFLLIVSFKTDQKIDIETFDQILAQPYAGIERTISMSTPHVEHAIEGSLKKDVMLISLLVLIVFLVIIFYTYRDIRALLYIVIIVFISILPTFFFFTVFKIPINLFTALTIPIILVLSLADAIHLLTGFYSHSGSANDRIISSMEAYLIPSFFTSLTTTIAFSSFLFSSAESIRLFGLIVSLSVLPSFIFTYFLTPFLFKKLIQPKCLPEHGIKKILKVFHRYTKPIAFSMALMAILAIPLAFQLKFHTNFDSFIPKNSPTLKHRNEMIKDFDSQLALHVLIKNDTSRSVKTRLKMEQDIRTIAGKFETISTVGNVKSITDELKFKKNYGPLARFITIPKNHNPYVGNNNNYRIELRLNTMDHLHQVNDEIKEILAQYKNDYQFEIFSKALLFDEVNKKVATSFLRSLLFSFILIFAIIFIITKSVLTTLISFLSNIIPLSFIVLLFYFLKLDLNILTTITVVVCLGLMVDDTIHVIYRKKVLDRENHELEYGIIATSNVLVLGFATFMISDFQPSQVLGLVSSIVLLVTAVADLVLLPYLLNLTRK